MIPLKFTPTGFFCTPADYKAEVDFRVELSQLLGEKENLDASPVLYGGTQTSNLSIRSQNLML